jgi:hypothetical protein
MEVVSPLVQVGVASRALPGQRASGDLAVVCGFPGGVLLAAIDGLGHGAHAAHAAERARAVLERHPADPVVDQVKRAHTDLVGTRGVVMSIASLRAADGALTWMAVGNVEAVLWRRDATGRVSRAGLLARGGVVGGQLPPLRPEVVSVSNGDTLVLATDGVGPDFSDGVVPDLPPDRLADRILARHGRTSDDALVLVARFALEG